MNTELKPIETMYKGCRFRSRLEARWAVLFEALGLPWEYEACGYDLGKHGKYLPDFWFPTLKMFGEVKPEEFTEEEKAKATALAEQSKMPVLMLIGTPKYKPYFAIERSLMGPEMEEVDYLIDDQYIHDEKRLFGCPGYDPSVDDNWCSERTEFAYTAARSARFEHGESPEC